MSLAGLQGKFGVIFLLATAGALGLREFLKLIGWQVLGTPAVIVLFASTPVYYLLVWFGFGDVVRWSAPIVFLIAIASTRSLSGLMESYIRTTAGSLLGWMLFVYGPSYTYFVTTYQNTSFLRVDASCGAPNMSRSNRRVFFGCSHLETGFSPLHSRCAPWRSASKIAFPCRCSGP